MADASVVFEPDLFRRNGWWKDETLRDWLTARVQATPDRCAIISPSGPLTYREFYGQARRLATALHERGIGHGDIVAVHLPNIPEFLISWLAINELGAAMQTVHTPYGLREVSNFLRHSDASACIALGKIKDRSPAREIDGLRASLPNLRFVLAVSSDDAGVETVTNLIGSSVEFQNTGQVVRGSDRFLLLYTSGTTSVPKAVSVTYNHFLSNAQMCAREFSIRPDDRILCLAPFTHLYGLYALQLGFSAGATTCLLDFFTPPGFIDALKRFKPTIMFAGPAHVSPCLQNNLFDGVDLSNLRIAVLSGSTAPAKLSAAFEEKLPNGRVLQAWGMTELQFGACSRPGDSSKVRFETIGRATPGTELRVADADGRELPFGTVGELQVRGCSLFSGYLNNAAAANSSFCVDKWFRTGDLAKMDEAGNVQLCGRSKELINRGGVKFNPVDIEIALSGHPAITQVAVAPLPDPILGERACCFAVLKPGAKLTFEQLRSFLEDHRFAKFTWPEGLVIVQEMPMTPTRKVIKSELVARYLASVES